jgi:hypothetical protein
MGLFGLSVRKVIIFRQAEIASTQTQKGKTFHISQIVRHSKANIFRSPFLEMVVFEHKGLALQVLGMFSKKKRACCQGMVWQVMQGKPQL